VIEITPYLKIKTLQTNIKVTCELPAPCTRVV